MDELREKLVAQDAGFDDRLVELIKVLIVNEHPFLIQTTRLRLTLDSVDDATVKFHAAYEHSERRFEVTLPRDVVDDLTQNPEELKRWSRDAHGEANVVEKPDGWANLWMWSGQPSALRELKGQAARLRAGLDIDHEAASFQSMLSRLPRGAHLPEWAKRDLQRLFDYAHEKELEQLQDSLFEIRFGFGLENDWTENEDEDDVADLWKLLRDLPDNNVEGNAFIRQILLDDGRGGGWYSPTTHDIAIGEKTLDNPRDFANVVLHEVGHAVHERESDQINDWLNQEFGWQIFSPSSEGIDAWVGLMGGWGDLTRREVREVSRFIDTALGRGGIWQPGPQPYAPARHPWWGEDFAPRLAYERSGASWYRNFRTWYQHDGNAFCMNFYYRVLMVVSTDTIDFIRSMPSSYAAMSHFEFFAELYAHYFDPYGPAGERVPQRVSAWFEANVVNRALTPRMPTQPVEKEAYEEITRPNA